MGKEQDLLEAARTGNIALIEKILSQRAKLKGPLGPLASLRRTANPSCQDSNGDTPLHHAALNGHREVVQLLLRYEASANLQDNKGCYPLHMAAWNGHTAICRILLTQGPSIAKVNQQNHDGETALHCAAQYGHTDTVGVLLEGHADPTIQNVKEESPLDLSCQYGRLDAVQLLLRTHPSLAERTGHRHPLLLAARNGHKAVVQALLEAGCLIDGTTESGTALHEAALFGRTEVVRLLLDSGINTSLTDANHRTALDVIREHKSQISIEISRIISEHISEKEYLARRAGVFTSHTSVSGQSSPSRSSQNDATSLASVGQFDVLYDDLPSPRPVVSTSPRPSSSSSLSSDISSLYAKANLSDKRECLLGSQGCDLDQSADDLEVEVADDNDSLFPIDLDGIQSWNCLHQSITSESSSVYDTPSGPARPFTIGEGASPQYDIPQPLTPVPRIKVYSSASASPGSAQSTPSPGMNRPSPKGSPRTHSPISPDTPKKPPRRKTLQKALRHEDDQNRRRDVDKNANAADVTSSKEQAVLLRSMRQNDNNNDPKVDNRLVEENQEITGRRQKRESLVMGRDKREKRESLSEEKKDTEKADLEKGEKELEDSEAKPTTDRTTDVQSTSSTQLPSWEESHNQHLEDEISLRSNRSSTASSRPPSLELGGGASSKRCSRECIPLSPTGYQQPPTPDHPPPSPSTAILGIQEKINPKEKRRSRDMETITESEFLSPDDSFCAAIWRTPDESGDADSLDGAIVGGGCLPCGYTEGSTGLLGEAAAAAVEVVTNGNDPFLGLTKGSLPAGQRRVKSQIYDSLVVSGAGGRKQKRVSAPGLFVSFDPVDEWDEQQEDWEHHPGGGSRARGAEARGPGHGRAPAPPCPGKQKVSSSSGSSSAASSSAASSSARDKNGRSYFNAPPGVYQRRHRMDAPKAPARTKRLQGKEAAKDDGTSPLDENEEWAKIEDIMASFGGGISRDSLFVKELEDEFARIISGAGRTMQSVGDWLESLGLGQYENTLVANGFDDMDFMGRNVLEEQDLTELGILVDDHRHTMLEASAELPNIKPICETQKPASVEDWLDSLRLSSYLEVFMNNNFTTMERVRNIWELELNTVLDITTLGHRKRILASLREASAGAGGRHKEGADGVVDIDWTLNPYTEKPASTSPAADVNLYRDYTSVRSSYKDGDDQNGDQDDDRGRPVTTNGDMDPATPPATGESGDLPIRPPHLAHQESPIKQWRHQPGVLIRGCCNYSAQYLGSTLVRQLQGTESTKESINKLKKSADSIAKVPTIVLSISYKGVKFIDAGSKKVVCEHEIGNIFCACQDGDNLNYFAYITKDLESAKHYCHVFCVRSTEQATEIILTLGEAFEIAYQMAVREKAEEGTLENAVSQTELSTSPLASPDGIDCGT